jgi:hypothetical protein
MSNDVMPEQQDKVTNKIAGVRRFLIVGAEHSPEKVRIEMRGDLPIGMLFPPLIRTLGWKIGGDEIDPHFRLVAINGEQEIELKSSDTLNGAGIQDGTELKIILINKRKQKGSEPSSFLSLQSSVALENGFTVGSINSSNAENRGTIAPPQWDEPVQEPSLIGPSGRIFSIQNPPMWIGRPDKGFRPEINLLSEDDRESPTSGRRHAQIFFEEKNFVLRARPTLNGTFVNGTEIRPNESCILREGDRVRFGDVEMIFRLP